MRASGTTSRGVEAKQFDTADTLDENCTSQCDSVARASSARTHSFDETNSYIQVVVQKARRARLPAASSPAAPAAHCRKLRMERERGREGGEGEALLLLLPPLAVAALPPAPPPAPAPRLHGHVRNEFPGNGKGDTGAGGEDARAPRPLRPEKKIKSWRLFHFDEDNQDSSDCDPERFEVYYFSSAEVSHLATRGGAQTHVERVARRAGRRAAALLAELLAAARLALAAPIGLLLALLRCCLELQRDAAAGLVQTWSDHALKPALALLYNAVLQPPLVFARAALRATCGVLGDALEPFARVIGALRLVHVHVERAPCRCACRHLPNDNTDV